MRLRRLLVSRPASSASAPIQMVGTPAATVTCSRLDEVGDRAGREVGAGHDQVAPAATAVCARPQALAWNMGTIGSTRSRSLTPNDPAAMTPRVCRNIERWL